MKAITKTAEITTERGTLVKMTVTVTKGFEMVNEELFNDGWNSTVKTGKVTEKTETTLTVNGKDYKGCFDVLPARMQAEKGCYGTFANIGLSQVKYNELTTVVAEARKEAETDQSWIDYSERKAKADQASREYDKHVSEMKKAMNY